MRFLLALLLLASGVLGLAQKTKEEPGELACDGAAIAFDFSSTPPGADAVIAGTSYPRASRAAYVGGFLGTGSNAAELFAPTGTVLVGCTITPARWCRKSQCYVAPWELRLQTMASVLAPPLSNRRLQVYVERATGAGQSRVLALTPVSAGMVLADGAGACVGRGSGKARQAFSLYFALELRRADAFAQGYFSSVRPNYRLMSNYDGLDVSFHCP